MFASHASAQATSGTAQSLSEARTHFERGIALFRQRDLAAALAEFLRAYDLSHRPSVLFNISATYQGLHRYPEALEALRRYMLTPSGNARQRAAAERALRELEALTAHLRIIAVPADASLTLDGRLVADSATDLVVGPGPHVIEGSHAGYQSTHEELMIASGESRVVRLELAVIAPQDAEPPITRRPQPASANLPRRGRLAITGAPTTATVAIDGVEHPAAEVAEVEPGTHSLTVSTRGMRAWSGDVVLTDDRPRSLQVSLVPEYTGPRPLYFGAAAVATGALAVGAIVFGTLTLQTDAQFQMRSQDDPDIDAIASRGRALAVTTDVFAVGALITGVLAVVLFTRTEFTRRASHAEFGISRPMVPTSLPHGQL